ncbi:MAG: hypothetical protein JHD07_21305 [Bradyrhizobium sp.]|jgi:hypothetical protein|uniref:hypothetical protein n=1 Tax=Bradyrhizobium sp. TaxID=376 RepID=UPI001A2949EE|nr:hypothetical protein [Bradyrhizobium sp.]MBJ7405702.1 hypothetical protein [Bradyrhizobium sp.]
MSDSAIESASQLDAELSREGAADDVRSLILGHADEPDAPAAKLAFERIVVTAGKERGTKKVLSARLRNWVLNWHKLLFDAGLSIAGGLASTSKLGIAVGLLRALKSLVENAVVELGEREASLVLILWSDPAAAVSKSTMLSRSGLTSAEFEKGLDGLISLGIIDIEDDDRIVKTERILFV